MRPVLAALLVLSGLFVTAPAATASQVQTQLAGGDRFIHNGRVCVAGFILLNQEHEYSVLTSGWCAQPGQTYGVVPPPAGSTPVRAVRFGTTLHPVAGSTVPPVGSGVCMPQGTGLRCGSVLAHNQTVAFPQGVFTGLTRTSLCMEGDESGAPVVVTGGRLYAAGVLFAGSGSCRTGGHSWYQPVRPVLSSGGYIL